MTQAVAEALGIGIAYLVWSSDLATAIQVGSWNFDQVNGWTVLIVGLVLGSSSSATFDTVKAIGSIGTTNNPLEQNSSGSTSVDSITINANSVTVTGTSTTSSDSVTASDTTDLTTANKGPDQ